VISALFEGAREEGKKIVTMRRRELSAELSAAKSTRSRDEGRKALSTLFYDFFFSFLSAFYDHFASVLCIARTRHDKIFQLNSPIRRRRNGKTEQTKKTFQELFPVTSRGQHR
jgi:hypothetical protein